MLTEEGRRAIHGQGQVVSHFTARLDDLRQGDTWDYLTVAGLFDEDADDAAGERCAIFYDGFYKACVFQLGVGDNGALVDRIVLSTREATLRRAWPIEPPAFRNGAILPALTEIEAER
jgi:hypothetical protein